MTAPPLLEVSDLRVDFPGRDGTVHAVRGVTLRVHAGESVALVGESGSGKSVTARAMLGLVPAPGRVVGGSVRVDGRDLATLGEEELRQLRGGRIGLVFQDAQSSLNPVMTVGRQIAEAMIVHGRRPAEARSRARELLALTGVPDPGHRLNDYPHQFSGGMRQRVMIALAMANDPAVLVADEPTTALDVTVQAQILEVFARLNEQLGTAIVLISHNLGVVTRLCRRVVVMYAGRVVEEAGLDALHGAPRHPYTWELLRAVPRLASGQRRLPSLAGRPPDLRHPPVGCAFAARCRFTVAACTAADPPLSGEVHRAACWVTADDRQLLSVAEPDPADVEGAAPPVGVELLAADGIVKSYPNRRGGAHRRPLQVLAGVSLRLRAGETLGLVGESGCGKSTLARLVLGLERPDRGTIMVRGTDLSLIRGERRKALRRQVQMIFQDPYASLNPRHSVAQLVGEPLRVHHVVPRAEIRSRVADLLEMVGLDPSVATRLPQGFSGGQRQRIAIARALALQPSLLVLDEPISALDVTLQAQIVNLLEELQRRLGLAYLFIAHDLAVVHRISHRIAVMYLGQIVETGPAGRVCTSPAHPYTLSLLSAVPEPNPTTQRERVILAGDPPSPLDPPAGCPFHTRCPIGPAFQPGRDRCRLEGPVLREITSGRFAACHFADEVASLDGNPDAGPARGAAVGTTIRRTGACDDTR